jgi:PEP-CTERM motif
VARPPFVHDSRGDSMAARTIFGGLLLALASGVAFAAAPVQVPEPGVIELLAVGAVVAGLIAARSRRK